MCGYVASRMYMLIAIFGGEVVLVRGTSLMCPALSWLHVVGVEGLYVRQGVFLRAASYIVLCRSADEREVESGRGKKSPIRSDHVGRGRTLSLCHALRPELSPKTPRPRAIGARPR